MPGAATAPPEGHLPPAPPAAQAGPLPPPGGRGADGASRGGAPARPEGETGLLAGGSFYECDASQPRRLERAMADLGTGLRRWRLAFALAWLDIRNRYRGSVIGPLWLTLSTAIMVVGLGVLYAALFKLPLVQFLPFVAVSLILWNMINQIVSEACGSLIAAEGIIRQLTLPYTTHVLRCVLRNIGVAAHSLPIILVVFAFCGTWPGLGGLMALPGLLLLVLNSFAVAMLLGMVCARFRDIAPIVASVMQIAFFLSPVLWKPELLGRHAVWLPLNPAYTLMETMRGPLLGEPVSTLVWLSAVSFTVLACAASFAFFVRFRGRIAFWV
ncbi:ABC transporter permease [Roseomonas sp. NAR14]|uniref:ABC transporter permease n=1 Tax=Roseomonas acroporae TaxID=2937791 RepID=A0A9X1YBD2_9PROT|nr:ABC transporter permease [Roseomonas acroporae]MCK8786981.1 ABC transporter permease [Roseomonas acroporae]